MKANELRIGNWVSITGSNICLNDPIKIAYIFEEDGLNTRCEPIPLTEEWFKRMGFSVGPNYHPEGVTYSLKIKGLLITTTSLYQYLWIGGVLVNDNLKYVHQVQNLIFALTGEELTLSE